MAVVVLKIYNDYLDNFYYFSVSIFNYVPLIFLIYNVDCTSKLTVQTKKKYILILYYIVNGRYTCAYYSILTSALSIYGNVLYHFSVISHIHKIRWEIEHGLWYFRKILFQLRLKFSNEMTIL